MKTRIALASVLAATVYLSVLVPTAGARTESWTVDLASTGKNSAGSPCCAAYDGEASFTADSETGVIDWSASVTASFDKVKIVRAQISTVDGQFTNDSNERAYESTSTYSGTFPDDRGEELFFGSDETFEVQVGVTYCEGGETQPDDPTRCTHSLKGVTLTGKFQGFEPDPEPGPNGECLNEGAAPGSAECIEAKDLAATEKRLKTARGGKLVALMTAGDKSLGSDFLASLASTLTGATYRAIDRQFQICHHGGFAAGFLDLKADLRESGAPTSGGVFGDALDVWAEIQTFPGAHRGLHPCSQLALALMIAFDQRASGSAVADAGSGGRANATKSKCTSVSLAIVTEPDGSTTIEEAEDARLKVSCKLKGKKLETRAKRKGGGSIKKVLGKRARFAVTSTLDPTTKPAVKLKTKRQGKKKK